MLAILLIRRSIILRISNKLYLVAFVLSHAVMQQAVVAKEIDEGSIPEPTQLSVIASDTAAGIMVLRNQNPIGSDDSTIAISVIEILASDTNKHWGIKVLLKNDNDMDSLYLDAKQASQLRDEFAGLVMWYQRNEICDAGRCIQGVARCRPSQTKRQAFCPGFYTTFGGERGIVLSTTRHSYNFPTIAPSEIAADLDAAVYELSRTASTQDPDVGK